MKHDFGLCPARPNQNFLRYFSWFLFLSVKLRSDKNNIARLHSSRWILGSVKVKVERKTNLKDKVKESVEEAFFNVPPGKISHDAVAAAAERFTLCFFSFQRMSSPEDAKFSLRLLSCLLSW